LERLENVSSPIRECIKRHTSQLCLAGPPAGEEEALAACQMCARHGLQTLTLWNWYKRDALSLVVQLALHAYLNEGVRFTRSLRAVGDQLSWGNTFD